MDLRLWLGARRKNNVDLGGGGGSNGSGGDRAATVTATATAIFSNTTALTSSLIALVVGPGFVERETHRHCEGVLLA